MMNIIDKQKRKNQEIDMRNKNQIRKASAALLAVMLTAGMIFQVSAEEAAKETETEAAQVIEIGEKAGDEDYEVTLVNESGKEIKEIALRASYEEYSDNLLPENTVLEDQGKGTLWCTPAQILNFVPPVYDIKLTFADDSTAVLHTLPFGDAEELRIQTDDESGTVYVKFFSLSLNAETDSLQSEKNIAASGEDGMIADYKVRTGQAAPEAAPSGDSGNSGASSQPAPAPAPTQQQCLDNGLMF